MAIDQDMPTKGQRELMNISSRQFKGCNTRSDRSQIPPQTFYNLENLIPIGDANIHTVNNISGVLNDFASDTVYWSQYAQIGGTSYQFCFTTTGKIIVYNYSSLVTTTIATGKSASGLRMASFYNKYVLFSDPANGLFSWDGTTFAAITGAAVPAVATDIAVYAGRTWVCNGRLITYTGVYDGTSTYDPTANTAWQAANGGGFIVMTDPIMQGNITRLWAQNGYLFIFSSTSLWSLSDVYVPSGASPPTPVFTLLNIQGIIGTDQPASVFPYNRSLVFANRYGGWMTDGVNAQRYSQDIDGTWQYLSFNPAVSGGQCVVQNILCTAFLLQRSNDPVFGSNTVIALWFDSKWWFANFGTITFLCTALINGVPTLVAFIGNKMYTLFTDTTTAPTAKAMTPLWDDGDPLSMKSVIRVGVQTVIFGAGTMTVTADGLGSSTALTPFNNINSIQFISNSSANINFVGAGTIKFTSSTSYNLFSEDSPGVFSKNIGMQITTTNVQYQLCGFFMDYKKGARWLGNN